MLIPRLSAFGERRLIAFLFTNYKLWRDSKHNILYFHSSFCIKCFILGKFDSLSDEGILLCYSMFKSYRGSASRRLFGAP